MSVLLTSYQLHKCKACPDFQNKPESIYLLMGGCNHPRNFANQRIDLHVVAFHFLIFSAVIADMDMGGDQDLTEIGRVCENFLITGHAGIKTNFAGSGAGFSSDLTFEIGAIL